VTENITYGNWIRKKILFVLGFSTLGLGILFLLLNNPYLRLISGVLFVMLLISLSFPLYAYYAFSPRGGNLQEKIYTLIVKSLGQSTPENALDIGTGNGVLALKLAQTYPMAQVIGLDYWGKNWEYSQAVCETNARTIQVADRVRFVKGDAAALEFDAAAFAAVVSNLTFHEVKSAPQKREVVREALRVLRPDGRFAFVDYFYDRSIYGPSAEFKTFLQSLGLSKIEFKHLSDGLPLPRLLQHPKIFGKVEPYQLNVCTKSKDFWRVA
jgi:ubiquinone/menaquinone biosynthesis C-methylase UbiE